MMQIGFLSADLAGRYGWARYSLSLIGALRDEGMSITVVTPQGSPTLEGVTVHPILPRLVPAERHLLLKQLRLTRRVRRLLGDCDLIHVTPELFAPLGLWVAGPRPLIITGHGTYVNLPQMRRWPVGALYRRAFGQAQMLCVSNYTAGVLRELLPSARTAVINNGVEAGRFATLPAFDAPYSGPLVLSVGAVKARKGTLELVHAMAAVHERMPGAHCIILGSLDDELHVAQVRATIAELGLGQHVHLSGPVDDATLLGWYGAADVFVLPSINNGWSFEGFGLVHLEASAAGLPVIGTRGCGVEDAIDDGVTGLLVSQERIAEELPAAMIEILSNPERAARFGAAGQRKAGAQTWAHVAGEVRQLYGAALGL